MKLINASDIHGSALYCRKLLEAWDREGAKKLLLLGDILYHGPRNDLPEGYAPKETMNLLNERKDRIYNVRGNCDAEVDQMVLQFPVLADYMLLFYGQKTIYATHGHIYNENNLPPMMPGDILLHGHTHVLRAEKVGEILICNPGSVSLPKEGNPPSYAIWEDGYFRIKDFNENILKEIRL